MLAVGRVRAVGKREVNLVLQKGVSIRVWFTVYAFSVTRGGAIDVVFVEQFIAFVTLSQSEQTVLLLSGDAEKDNCSV